jgi:molecular chaperone GrpE
MASKDIAISSDTHAAEAEALSNEQQEGQASDAKEAGGTEPVESSELSEVEILTAKVRELEQLAASYKDQLLRKAAEFENYKRRSENEFASFTRYANEGLIQALLPVLDDFIRSLKSGKEQKDYDAFFKGVELIYAKLNKVLENQGLKPIDSIGKPFDVAFHDALLVAPRKDVELHTVVEEVEKGYILHDKVIRPAKVIISGEKDDGTGSSDSSKTG